MERQHGSPHWIPVWLAENDGDEPDYSLELSKGAAGWSVSHERYRTDNGWIEQSETTLFEFPTENRGTVRTNLRGTLRSQVSRYRNDSAAQQAIAPIFSLSDQLGSTWHYRPSVDDIARIVHLHRSVLPTREERSLTVGASGSGLAYELQRLQGEDRETFTKIEEHLQGLFPHIRTIGFKSDFQGVRLTYMTKRSEGPIPAPLEADGVLLSTFLLGVCTLRAPACACAWKNLRTGRILASSMTACNCCGASLSLLSPIVLRCRF